METNDTGNVEERWTGDSDRTRKHKQTVGCGSKGSHTNRIEAVQRNPLQLLHNEGHRKTKKRKKKKMKSEKEDTETDKEDKKKTRIRRNGRETRKSKKANRKTEGKKT